MGRDATPVSEARSAEALTVVGAVIGLIYGWPTWLFLAQLRRRSSARV